RPPALRGLEADVIVSGSRSRATRPRLTTRARSAPKSIGGFAAREPTATAAGSDRNVLRLMPPSFPGTEPSVDDQRRPGDERGVVAREIRGGGCHFVGPAHPAERVRSCQLAVCLLRVRVLAQPRAYERRLHASGADAVHANAVSRMVEREAFGEADDG